MKPSANLLKLYFCILLLHACAAPALQTNKPSPAGILQLMTDEDIKLANRAVQRALETTPSGTPITWQNSSNGHFGSVTPRRTYKSRGGFYCRVYTEILTVADKTERFDGTACRASDGLWNPV